MVGVRQSKVTQVVARPGVASVVTVAAPCQVVLLAWPRLEEPHQFFGHRGILDVARAPWSDLAVTGVITTSEPSWIAPFSGLRPRLFGKLVTVLRREGADAVRKGRPWRLPLRACPE